MRFVKKLLPYLLIVVLTVSFTSSVHAASSKTIDVKKRNYYVNGEADGGWWWWSNPTITIRIDLKGGSDQRVGICCNGVDKGTVSGGRRLSFPIKGSWGQPIKYSILIQPIGRPRNGSYGKVTVSASAGNVW